MAILFKAGNHVRTYRHGPKCQKHPVANAAIHVHGKMSRSKGQILSNFSVSLLWPITSPQSQKSKPIELKFVTKERERDYVLHAKFSHDLRRGWVGIKAPQSPKFHFLNALLASIFCCQVRGYVPIMLKFGTKLYTVGILSRVRNLSLIGDRVSVQVPPNFHFFVRFRGIQLFVNKISSYSSNQGDS